MNPEIWNVFHDGYIESAEGQIPGNVRFLIVIGFRDEFVDPGAAFRMEIFACDMISFMSFHTNQTASGMEALKGEDLEILVAKLEGTVLTVITTGGKLQLHYDSEIVSLDSGRKMHLSDLEAAANNSVLRHRKSKT